MRRALLLAAAGALLLAGCADPESQPGVYRQQASLVLQDAAGEVQTAKLVVQARIAGKTFPTSADDTVTGSEEALDSLVSTFGAGQPPPGSDPVRDSTLQALSEAQDAVAAARIAIRRDDRRGLLAALGPVNQAVQSLGEAQERLA